MARSQDQSFLYILLFSLIHKSVHLKQRKKMSQQRSDSKKTIGKPLSEAPGVICCKADSGNAAIVSGKNADKPQKSAFGKSENVVEPRCSNTGSNGVDTKNSSNSINDSAGDISMNFERKCGCIALLYGGKILLFSDVSCALNHVQSDVVKLTLSVSDHSQSVNLVSPTNGTDGSMALSENANDVIDLTTSDDTFGVGVDTTGRDRAVDVSGSNAMADEVVDSDDDWVTDSSDVSVEYDDESSDPVFSDSDERADVDTDTMYSDDDDRHSIDSFELNDSVS